MPESQFLQPAAATHPAVSHHQNDATHNFALLRQMPLWAGIPDEAVQALADVAHLDQKRQHFTLFEVDNPGSEVYFLCSGAVAFFLKNAAKAEVFLEERDTGFFGEVAVLYGGTRTATARVTKDMIALKVGRDDLLQVLHAHPDLMIAMYRETARRLGRTSSDLRLTTARNPNDLLQARKLGALDRSARFFGSVRLLKWNAGLLALWFIILLALHKNPLDGVPYNALGLFFAVEAIVITCIVLHSQYRQEDADVERTNEWYRSTTNAENAILNLNEQVRELRAELKRRPLDTAPPATPTIPPQKGDHRP